MSARRALWFLALLLLALAAAFTYSPRFNKHAPALGWAGTGLFVLGWLVAGELNLTDD